MESYKEYIERLIALGDEAKTLPPPDPARAADAEPAADAPTVLICSPHPDDECITGLAALRLQREAGMHVVNLGITLGSNKKERPRRKGELEDACAYLGWDLRLAGPEGLDAVTRAARRDDPAGWAKKVGLVATHMLEVEPRVILFPHERDWNGTHEGVNALVWDVLETVGGALDVYTLETEFWHAMDAPNIMVEADTEDLALLTAATSLHRGEVARNPYHLLLPAWMQDNVRRGGERVGGQGGAPPDFRFAALYRLRRWASGKTHDTLIQGRFVSKSQTMDAVLA